VATIEAEISRLQQARSLLAGSTGTRTAIRGGKHTMSAEARARISAAQKKRWAQRRKVGKAKGKHLGRAAILKPAQVKELRKRVAAGEDKAGVAKTFGISRASVYNYMAQSQDRTRK
jgi:DNA invertase Pin-like site-specific DNA recombinase